MLIDYAFVLDVFKTSKNGFNSFFTMIHYWIIQLLIFEIIIEHPHCFV